VVDPVQQIETPAGRLRVIDLTTPLDPATCTRRLKLRRFLNPQTQDYHTEADITSHLGTHVESPYHFRDGWKDVSEMPVTAFMGRAVLLKLEGIAPRAPITARDLDAADQGRVQPGDVCILDSPFHSTPFVVSPDDKRPYLCRESGEWFVGKKAKSIGFGDGIAIEFSVKTASEMHETVMPRDITFIEVLKNINLIQDRVFFLMFQPLPVKGLDSCPVRAVAIEGLPGFRP